MYQRHMAQPMILFVEDEVDHFEAVKEHLEPDFKCARSRALQVEAIVTEIKELKPSVIVLDLMLFTSTGAAKAAGAACQRSMRSLEADCWPDRAPKRSRTAEAVVIEIPTMATDWLRALKKMSPGIPIIACSQLEATVGSLEELVVDAVPKRLDMDTRLINGKEIAEKVRGLIKG